MPFRFQALSVAYETSGRREETVFSGYLMEGSINGPEQVIVPTRSGMPNVFSMSSMQTRGNPSGRALYPILPGPNLITLGLCGHPPDHDVPVPCVLVADGVQRDE
jgi:hypothetical protein